MKYLRLILLLVLCVALTACAATTANTPTKKGGTGKPYTVRGKTYHPYATAHGYSETGIASWYGPGFHGKSTANGERYNQNAMTAAHKLLPMGTQLQVTNLSNGRSIVVRINDRGPFVGNRIIDLSKKAAENLGMIGSGTARVRLVAIGPGAPQMDNSGDMPGMFYVQVGAFSVPANARKAMQVLKAMQVGGRIIKGPEGRDLEFVQAGPFPGLHNANNAMKALEARFPGLFVIAP